MKTVTNERGAVLVWITLMIVLLLIMVGMGLDMGQVVFSRATGQAAVDAAALSAVTGLPSGNHTQVVSRATALTQNDYTGAGGNPITGANVSYGSYDDTTGTFTTLPNIAGANAVRVAMEKTNPYSGGAAGTGMQSPAFLTPLLNLIGSSAQKTHVVSVSAVAALRAIPGIPIAVMEKTCNEQGSFELKSQNVQEDNMCWTAYLDGTNTSTVKKLFEASRDCSGDLPQGDLVKIGTDISLQNGVGEAFGMAEEVLIGSKGENVGKCWFVPVIKNVDKGGCNQTKEIQDWAKICPTAVVKHGSHSTIKTTIQCKQTLFNATANLCFSSRLLREPQAGM